MPQNKREVEKKINDLNPALTTANELGRIVERLDEVIPILQDIKQQEVQFPEVQQVTMDKPINVQMGMPELPEVIFPEIQKVEVINQIKFPEQKAPIVNVQAPIVNVPEAIINLPEIKFPKEMKVEVTNFPEVQKVDIQKVELVDKNGKPVDMKPVVNVSPSYPSPFQYGGRGATDSVKVTNSVTVTATNLEVAQGSTTASQVGPLIQGAVTTNAPTYVTGQTSPLSLSTSGALRVNVTTVTPGGGATALGKAEDAAHTSGDTGVFMLAVRNDANAVLTDTDLDYSPISVSSSGNLKIIGNLAHDAVDSGNPIKIGAKATDYTPTAAGQQGQTAVAAADRVDIATNLRGEIVEGVKAEFTTLTNISATYNNTTTTATSGAVTCWQYRQATFAYELDKANTPTDILVEFLISLDGTNYTILQNDFLGDLREDDTAVGSGLDQSVTFPIACQLLKVKVTATGTDATNTFTVANAVIYFRN